MIFFYLFAFTTVFSSLMVVSVRNTVHAVFWLVFTFFSSSGLFLLAGAEFLAMMIIIVYVGAVAVLFLFVVMMLDLQKKSNINYKTFLIGLPIIALFIANMFTMIFLKTSVISRSDYAMPAQITNTHAIGNILYTDFMLHFQIAGIILFVAIIGCITLTLRPKLFVRKQSEFRNKSNSIKIIKSNV